MSNQPKVSIITINYNNLRDTLEFLESSRKLNYKNYEVIVVDNNSHVSPKNEIKEKYSDVVVIESSVNLGFAGGNNLGINQSKGDFIFLVNNDTELTPDILQPLISIFERYENVGAVSPKFRYFYNKGVIEYAGYTRVSMFTGRNFMIGCGDEDDGQYDTISLTNYTHGGGMMLSRSAVQKVGLMPELFFLYYEEFDWCEKFKKKGFKIYYQPNSLIYHKVSMTTGKNSRLKTYYLNRNRILFMKRNRNIFELFFFTLYLVIISIPKNTINFSVSRNFGHLLVYFKAIFWNIFKSKYFEFK